jgi:lysophospholipid acyltransferase (LPLAT)-like uncharacterized protein
MGTIIPGILYASPLAFTKQQRLFLGLATPVVTTTLRVLSCTYRCEVRGLELWKSALQEYGQAIVALWHEAMIPAVCHYRNTGCHTLASYSFDAELGTRVIRRLGIMAVRGSSSNGGSDALRDLAVVLQHVSVVALTLDGPHGPRRIAKPGAAILAARTGVPIIPHAFVVRPTWRLQSWDQFIIAKPFAQVISVYGTAIPPPVNTNPDTIEETRLRVENSLNDLYQEMNF